MISAPACLAFEINSGINLGGTWVISIPGMIRGESPLKAETIFKRLESMYS